MNHHESYLLIWHLILFLSVAWPKSTKAPRFYSIYRRESEQLRNTHKTRHSFHEGLIEEKKKRKIWSCVGKTSCLTWGCDRYVIHTRLTIPTRSTTTRSDSVTSWTKEKGNVREFNNHHRHHHYSRKDVFPQEASARGRILCSKQ